MDDNKAGGKCEDRLDVPVPSDLAEAIAALATIHGMSKAQYARDVLQHHVYGHLEVLRSKVHGRDK